MANGSIIGTVNDPVLGDKITTFNSPGTFTPTLTSGRILVVGGGAGSGGGGGGGGAGGFRDIPGHPFPGSPVPVTVGGGGAGTNGAPASTGGDGGTTTFGAASPIASSGGGGGGGMSGSANSGGSGGGIRYHRNRNRGRKNPCQKG